MKWFILMFSLIGPSIVNADVRHLLRFEHNQQISYGEINGEFVQPLSGELFGTLVPHGKAIPLSSVRMLLPTEPEKVFAVGMNFDSHLSSPSAEPPPLFLKLPSSLIVSGQPIYLPADATNVHFEGELVLVIGKQAKNIKEADADSVIFAVTTGNDLTERNWQSSDLQWMRSKASDGFGPVGSIMAVGVDYNNLLLTTRLNGAIVQQENTKYMIHKPAKVVSYLSRYFTLMPGDLIFMGTPGRTKALKAGDLVSVSIEQVGTVENEIKQ
jgi:2-keto-4-pentenoate hydratase/2-oxohepta-3-ene-1,7-dioic acid hydratase in catechol pathway